MDDSSASETTESSSSDISSTIFLTVPDIKPNTLPEKDFCLFVLVDRIGDVSNSMYYFNTAAFFISFLQQFFAIRLPLSGSGPAPSLGPFTRFQSFLVTLMFEPMKGVSSAFFYFVLDLLCLGCVIAMLNGLIFAYRRIFITNGWAKFFTIFAVDVPMTLKVPVFYHLILVMLDEYRSGIRYFQFFYLLFVFSILAWMHVKQRDTMWNSIVYHDGLTIRFWGLVDEQWIGLSAIMVQLIGFRAFNQQEFSLLVILMNIVVGIGMILHFNYTVFLSPQNYGSGVGRGVAFLCSGAVHALAYYGVEVDSDIVLVFLVFILMCASYTATSYKKATLKKMAAMITPDFESMAIKDGRELVEYVMAGLNEGVECVTNGALLEWGLAHFEECELRKAMLTFQLFLLKTPPSLQKSMNVVRMHTRKTLSQRYADYENERIMNMRCSSVPTPSVTKALIELEARIGHYQHMAQTLASKMSPNIESNYLYLNIHMALEKKLTSAMMYLRHAWPNSPDVAQVYALFKSVVKRNETGANKWRAFAAEILKGPSLFAQSAQLRCLNLFPETQNRLLDYVYQQNSHIQRHSFSSSRARFQELQRKSAKTYDSVTRRPKLTAMLEKYKRGSTLIPLTAIVVTYLCFLSCFLYMIYSFGVNQTSIQRTGMFVSDFSDFVRAFHDFVNVQTSNYLDVAETKKYIANSAKFETAFAKFFANLKEYGFEDKDFSEQYSWLTQHLFTIPSCEESDIQDQFMAIVARFSTLYRHIFMETTDENKNYSYQLFLSTLSDAPEYLGRTTIRIASTSEHLIETYRENMLRGIIKFFCLATPSLFSLLIIPMYYVRSAKELSKLFSNEGPDSQSRMSTYLTRGSVSLRATFAHFGVLLLILFSVPVFLYQEVSTISGVLEASVIDNCQFVLTSVQQFVHFSSTLMYLRMVLAGEMPESVAVERLLKSRDYITESENDLRLQYLLTADHFWFTEILVNLVNGSSLVKDGIEDHVNILAGLLENRMTYVMKRQIAEMIHELEVACTDKGIWIGDVAAAATIFFFFPIFFITLISLSLSRSIGALIDFILFLSSHEVRTRGDRERDSDETQSRQLLEFSHKSVLDIYDRPCAMIDSMKYIAAVNMAWYSYFNTTPDCVLGFNIEDFIDVNDPDCTIKPIDDRQSILILEKLRRKEFLERKLKIAEQQERELRALMIPSKFIDMRSGTFEVGFNVACTLTFTPASDDSVNPDDWAKDVKFLEQYLQAKASEEADVLRRSSQNLLLLYGLKGDFSPEELVVKAFTALVDVLRASQEYEWITRGVDIYAVMACGEHATFSYTEHLENGMTMTGDSFTKLRRLQTLIEINSIIFDSEVNKRLTDLRVGFRADEVAADVYMFCPLPEREM